MRRVLDKSPISGTNGYTICLETHEIFNSEDKRMKPFVDSRGRVSIKLRTENGQKVFIIKDIASKISSSKEKQKVSSYTYDMIFDNIADILSYEKGIDRYLFTKSLIVNGDLDIIKKVLKVLN